MIPEREAVSLVILAKDPAQAKSRLGLSSAAARRVALLLAATTIRTAIAAERVGAVFVVTGDGDIARDAVALGAHQVPEPRPVGMNSAAALGRQYALRIRPSSPVAIMVADLPIVRPAEINDAVGEFLDTRRPLFVADHLGVGTTFVISGYRHSGATAFGPGSASLHRVLGYSPARLDLTGLRTDLDTRSDLLRLQATWTS